MAYMGPNVGTGYVSEQRHNRTPHRVYKALPRISNCHTSHKKSWLVFLFFIRMANIYCTCVDQYLQQLPGLKKAFYISTMLIT